MFDEIQLIKGWERYVRQKLDENFQVFVTGANASFCLAANWGRALPAGTSSRNFTHFLTTNILEYFSHLENSYLLAFIPMFDYSLKKQNNNPKRVYAIDTGLVEINTPNFTKDAGHKLKNLVFLALRQRSKRPIIRNI